MNFKNLMMWGVIVLLIAGLFQLFQNPKNSMPIFKATNKEYNIAVITPAHSKILLFIKVF